MCDAKKGNLQLPIMQVQQSFADAAVTYDAAATVQWQVANDLCNTIPFGALPQNTQLLDVGSGTGSLCQILSTQYPNQTRLWQKTALDIAMPMLSLAKAKQVAHVYVLANAENLPFNHGQVDICVSNMALQWCDFAKVLAEMHRVLHIGGQAVLSLVLPHTFWQLAHVWQQQGLVAPVMPFASKDQLLSAIDSHHWKIILEQERVYQAHYPDLRSMLQSIKQTGAQQYPKSSQVGLLGKARWLALQEQFALLATDLGLPLDYRILFLQLEKTS